MNNNHIAELSIVVFYWFSHWHVECWRHYSMHNPVFFFLSVLWIKRHEAIKLYTEASYVSINMFIFSGDFTYLITFSCRGAEYCDQHVCVFVRLSLSSPYLSVHSHISKATCPNFTKFSLYIKFDAVPRSSSDDNAIRYVLCGWRSFHVQFARWQHREQSFCLLSQAYWIFVCLMNKSYFLCWW